MVKYIDLFCGLGAFHTAFTNLDQGHECVFACDIKESVRTLYELNYGIKVFGDINSIDPTTIPDFDILCAGFPCQPFSIAGSKNGFNDVEKGNLFYSILKILDAKNPPNIILENVKNLKTIHNGDTFATMQTELSRRGYNIQYKVLNSKDFGSAQARERIFIVGQKNTINTHNTHNTHNIFDFNRLRKRENVIIADIIDPTNIANYNWAVKYNLVEKTNISNNIASGKCNMVYILMNKTTLKGGRQGERVYSIEGLAPTICASSGGPGAKTGLYFNTANNTIRRLNVLECLRLFGFKDDYKYKTVMKDEEMLFSLGNSIVVNVCQAVVSELIG